MVPDLWDQGFLPVSRRSVAARLPRDSPRNRAARNGESPPPLPLTHLPAHDSPRYRAARYGESTPPPPE